MTRSTTAALFGLVLLVGIGQSQEEIIQSGETQPATQTQTDSESEAPVPAQKVQLPPIVDNFTPTITDHDLDSGIQRAWETRPYRVAVWLCLDGSPGLNANYGAIVEGVTQKSELIDPSGWDLSVGPAPSQWRNRFLAYIETPEKLSPETSLDLPNKKTTPAKGSNSVEGQSDNEPNGSPSQRFETLSALATYDKLMVVCLNSDSGLTRIRVREFDLQTQQWGPLLDRQTARQSDLAATITNLITVAFMPLARVERVTRINEEDVVFLQARAIDACYRTILNSNLDWERVPIKGSPVSIKDDDRFLPVVRRTDRQGNLIELSPIEFTFLTINQGKNNGAHLQASIESALRNSLGGRESKRSQKLALVIRPPQQPTRLVLKSRDEKQKYPAEGFEIWSRRPGAGAGEKSELLGKTDWEGAIEIPPSDEGMRLIYVKRGSRALKKLPIIPGFRRELVTTVANDAASLYAEGVIQGLEQEVLNLIVLRQIFEADIGAALAKKDLDAAKAAFKQYQSLEAPQDIKIRMSEEESRLRTMTTDKRETLFISGRFAQLKKVLNSQLVNSKDSQLQEEIQKQSNL